MLHIGNDLELVPDLWLTTGLAAIYTRRETQVTYPDGQAPLSQHDWDYAPRIGLRYDFTPQLQVYGNLSRSVEPPHAWSMIWGSNKYFGPGSGPATGLQREGVSLKNQTATTLEVGGRGDAWFGQWDLALYRSEVRHELLTVETQAQTPTSNAILAEANASPTVHQGVELSLLSPLWDGGGSGKLALRQAYTFSDFHYRNDDRFGDNTLPGIPKHYYQAQLRYSHPTGFYTSLNTEHSSRVAVDYANSYYAAAYTLLGATFGYDAPQQDWQAWVDLRNLTNRRYANTVTPGYDDKGLDAARSTPGTVGASTPACRGAGAETPTTGARLARAPTYSSMPLGWCHSVASCPMSHAARRVSGSADTPPAPHLGSAAPSASRRFPRSPCHPLPRRR